MNPQQITPATSGLALCITVVMLFNIGFVVDWALMKLGLPMITTASRSYPPLAYIILLVWLAGGMGLADHFAKK